MEAIQDGGEDGGQGFSCVCIVRWERDMPLGLWLPRQARELSKSHDG